MTWLLFCGGIDVLECTETGLSYRVFYLPIIIWYWLFWLLSLSEVLWVVDPGFFCEIDSCFFWVYKLSINCFTIDKNNYWVLNCIFYISFGFKACFNHNNNAWTTFGSSLLFTFLRIILYYVHIESQSVNHLKSPLVQW